MLAKELATLDQLSGGRLLLGIGVGWLEEEFDAIGVPFAERGARTDEASPPCARCGPRTRRRYHGEFIDFTDCVLRPAPGAGERSRSTSAATPTPRRRRAGRLGDGFFPGRGDHDELGRLFEVVRATAREHGRDPTAIELTTGGKGAIGDGALDEVKAPRRPRCRPRDPPVVRRSGATPTELARYGDEVIAKVP